MHHIYTNRRVFRRSLTQFIRRAVDAGVVDLGKLRQIVFDELAIDISTTAVDPVWSTLLGPTPIVTTPTGALVILFSATVTANAGVAAQFRVRVDGAAPTGVGTPYACTSTSLFNVQAAETGIYVVLPTDGAHTVSIEWSKQVNAPAAALIAVNPVAAPVLFHANMIIMEVEQ